MASMGSDITGITSRLPLNQKQLLGVIVSVYFLTRVLFIINFPIFNDEAIYLRYGGIMIESQPFYSVTAIGKQPLLLWIYGSFVHLFLPLALFLSRFISVLAGVGSLIMVYLMGRKIGGGKTGIVASLFYVFSPAFLLHDGMAVVDGVLAFLFAAVCYTMVKAWDHFRVGHMIVIAVLVGIGLWIKTTALLFLIIAFLFLVLARKRVHAERLLLSGLILAIIPLLILLPFIAHKEFVHMFRYQQAYAMTIPELLAFPVGTWGRNVVNALFVYIGYVSPFVLIGACIAVVQRKTEKTILLAGAFVMAFILLVLTGRALNTRYVVFSAIPLFPLAAVYLMRYRVLTAVALGFMAVGTVLLVVSPVTFFRLYPQVGLWQGENWQYINGWPSGYGVMEALAYVNSHRKGNVALVGVRWDSGNPEDTVLLFSQQHQGLEATFLDAKLAQESEAKIQQYAGKPIYYVTRNNQYGGFEQNALIFLARFPKPDGKEAVEVYLLNH